MRPTIILVIQAAILSFIFSCLPSKRSKDQIVEINTARLIRLSKYLTKHDKVTYDLNTSLVKLSIGYDTIEWENEIGDKWKGEDMDSLHNKYLYYGIMLDSLLRSAEIDRVT